MTGAELLKGIGVSACAVLSAALAVFVWTRRQGMAGRALALLLLAVTIWNITYGAELLSLRPGTRLFWGDLKYVGIGLLVPGWLIFILSYTGRGQLVTRRLVLALLIEPVVLLALLPIPATHDLVRHLPAHSPDPHARVVPGPLFWVHLTYSIVLLVGATGVFVWWLYRNSRAYWVQAAALSAAAVLPLAANLLFNLDVGRFGELDLTPVTFTFSGAVLAWGLYRQRLLRLEPVARGVLVERMVDAVIVLDAFDHVVDANPAAARLLGSRRKDLLGAAAAVLPAAMLSNWPEQPTGGREVRLSSGGKDRILEVGETPLPGRKGQVGGRLLVLRDITERAQLERQLRELLGEQARVAMALSESLRPSALPLVEGARLAARYRPAGSGREIGGDFFDVFQVGSDWAFMLGDVSGKGAKAAAATASARYALRALATAGYGPVRALQFLHESIAGQYSAETYLTIAHGRLEAQPAGGLRLRLVLGGHPQPFHLSRDGTLRPVGELGSAIGLFNEVHLLETDLCLRPGESLFLFSDGVSEARSDGHLLGEDGLRSFLATIADEPAETIAEKTLQYVLDFQSGQPADDIAILVVQADR